MTRSILTSQTGVPVSSSNSQIIESEDTSLTHVLPLMLLRSRTWADRRGRRLRQRRRGCWRLKRHQRRCSRASHGVNGEGPATMSQGLAEMVETHLAISNDEDSTQPQKSTRDCKRTQAWSPGKVRVRPAPQMCWACGSLTSICRSSGGPSPHLLHSASCLV